MSSNHKSASNVYQFIVLPKTGTQICRSFPLPNLQVRSKVMAMKSGGETSSCIGMTRNRIRMSPLWPARTPITNIFHPTSNIIACPRQT